MMMVMKKRVSENGVWTGDFRRVDIQGYLAHNKLPHHRTLQWDYAQDPMAISGGGAVAYERGTPVRHSTSVGSRTVSKIQPSEVRLSHQFARYHERRRCSRDTYPGSYITKYTCIRRKQKITASVGDAGNKPSTFEIVARQLLSSFHSFPGQHVCNPLRLRAERGKLKTLDELLSGSQGQNMGLTVLYVPYSLDSGLTRPRAETNCPQDCSKSSLNQMDALSLTHTRVVPTWCKLVNFGVKTGTDTNPRARSFFLSLSPSLFRSLSLSCTTLPRPHPAGPPPPSPSTCGASFSARL